jgi:hypothetical protein
MSEKFQKAFRLMLSTTHPGECVAARDGLVKIAKTNGHDIHQLVAVLAKALTTVIPGDKPEPDPPEPNDHRDKAEYIWERFENWSFKLNEREREFVVQMTTRRWRPTERQASWLNDIYKRAKRTA